MYTLHIKLADVSLSNSLLTTRKIASVNSSHLALIPLQNNKLHNVTERRVVTKFQALTYSRTPLVYENDMGGRNIFKWRQVNHLARYRIQ
jgi:hypothetical protein